MSLALFSRQRLSLAARKHWRRQKGSLRSRLLDMTRCAKCANRKTELASGVTRVKRQVSTAPKLCGPMLIFSVHVACAHQAGYILGFDIAPVKGSRRDQFSIVNIDGEIGTMTAAIWCKEHVPTKTIVHRMHDIVDASSGLNALQLYVQNFKQADLTLTGTVRKATLVNQSTKVVNPVVTPTAANRRTSTTSGVNGNGIGRGSISHIKVEEAAGEPASVTRGDHEKTCVTCQVSVSPKWWPFPQDVPDEHTTDSSTGTTVTNGDQHPNEMPLTNGHVAGNDEVVGGHIALAAACFPPAWPGAPKLPVRSPPGCGAHRAS